MVIFILYAPYWTLLELILQMKKLIDIISQLSVLRILLNQTNCCMRLKYL